MSHRQLMATLDAPNAQASIRRSIWWRALWASPSQCANARWSRWWIGSANMTRARPAHRSMPTSRFGTQTLLRCRNSNQSPRIKALKRGPSHRRSARMRALTAVPFRFGSDFVIRRRLSSARKRHSWMPLVSTLDSTGGCNTRRSRSGRSVADEAKATHLPLGNPEGTDMGALAQGRDDSPDRRVV